MDGDGHVVGQVADGGVYRVGVHRDVLLRVVAELSELFLYLRVPEHRDRRVVELQIAAARLVEVGDLFAIAPREVGPEVVEVRVMSETHPTRYSTPVTRHFLSKYLFMARFVSPIPANA